MPSPNVVVHVAISLDARIDGFEPDVGTYYDLIGTWNEDATLCGSGTILAAQPEPDPEDASPAEPPDSGDPRPLLAVIDSRGRIRSWSKLIAAGHWRGGLALCSSTTPEQHLVYLREHNIEYELVGSDQVDLKNAIESLARRGAKTIRIDAGPTLNGLALRSGIVDELSLLVHPLIVGDGRSFAEGLDAPIEMRELSREQRGELLWLRYARR
jgi:2,5-diamino-6-(ribosylamino)-4(3H)-pyrimidinone 5'-phosphate reductase